MEQKLTPEEVAKVFAMYLLCKYKRDGESGIDFGSVNGMTISNILNGDIDSRQLLLTPLAAITDEDAIEVGELQGGGDNQFKHRPNLIHLIRYVRNNIDRYCENNYKVYSYLTQQSYAVPLWFNAGHWANGKTAIELGIALNKTLR